MSLVKRGRYFHYEFQLNGVRYRGSTKQTTQTKARMFEAGLMAEIRERGYSPIPKRAPLLREFAETVLQQIDDGPLDKDTRRYYRNGWNRLKHTALAGMRLDQITTEAAAIQLDGSPSWQNQAYRTLSMILAKAVERHYLHQKPRIRLAKEQRREILLNTEQETALLEVALQPLKDVLLIMRDTGMRPDEVFRMRWEQVDWTGRWYFNTQGKTSKARRRVPLTVHVVDALKQRAGKHAEWVFPSRRKKVGHITTVAKQFRQARVLAGLPEALKLYGARHAFATDAVAGTGNVFAVRDVMGHQDLKTTAIYQHPELDAIREAIEERNKGRIM